MMVYFWFRRDLRIDDNTALYHALTNNKDVKCIFIFDSEILSKLPDSSDKRVSLLHDSIRELRLKLQRVGSDLWVEFGNPTEIWKNLLKPNDALYFNKDYEPYAIKRDNSVKKFAAENSVHVFDFKDHVIFEENELLSQQNTVYTVFTPYAKKWLQELEAKPIQVLESDKCVHNLIQTTTQQEIPTIEKLGFTYQAYGKVKNEMEIEYLKKYEESRDYPAIENGTSRLSVALRFGFISIRKLVLKANRVNATYLKELIWRDFFIQILFHYPQTISSSFKSAYDLIEWRNDELEFEKWCSGTTGIPMVDAGMRELNQTGYMHNRVRMIVASYLCKNLLIHWTWGEAYFASKLLDYEQALNVGNWQWAAGSGCDAAPYFRVFNPMEQGKKFDPDSAYRNKYLGDSYRIDEEKLRMELSKMRERALQTYKKGLEKAKG